MLDLRLPHKLHWLRRERTHSSHQALRFPAVRRKLVERLRQDDMAEWLQPYIQIDPEHHLNSRIRSVYTGSCEAQCRAALDSPNLSEFLEAHPVDAVVKQLALQVFEHAFTRERDVRQHFEKLTESERRQFHPAVWKCLKRVEKEQPAERQEALQRFTALCASLQRERPMPAQQVEYTEHHPSKLAATLENTPRVDVLVRCEGGGRRRTAHALLLRIDTEQELFEFYNPLLQGRHYSYPSKDALLQAFERHMQSFYPQYLIGNSAHWEVQLFERP